MRPLPIEYKSGVLVVRPSGAALNEYQEIGLRQSLYETLANMPNPRVALDLSTIDFISSTGIAFLIGTKRRVESDQGQVVLFGVHPDVQKILDSMKLTTLLDIAASETEALGQLALPPAS